MSNTRTDQVNLNLNVNGNSAFAALNKTEEQISRLREKLTRLNNENKKGTAEWKKTKKQLNETEKKYAKLSQSIDFSQKSIKQLRRELSLLKAQRNVMSPISKEFQQASNDIERYQRRIERLETNSVGISRIFKRMTREAKQFGLIALTYLSFQGVASLMGSWVSGSAKMSDALADVTRTTGFTNDELAEFNRNLREIDTRTARKDLLDLGKVAGKLGVKGVEDVTAFTDAADKLVVSLKEDLGGGNTEEIIRQIGKLVNLFDIDKEFGLGPGMLKIGSAINELGVNSTASEEFMVSFTKRFGGVASQSNAAIADVLGLASALDQLGITSEVSATALSKFFLKIGSDSTKFAAIAGMSLDDFNKLLKNDVNEAFIAVLKGADASGEGLSALSAIMEQFGIDGARASQVVGGLTGNISLIRKEQRLANSAFTEGTSIIDEFNIKNNTFAANLDKIRKRLYKVFVNQAIIGGMQKFVSRIADTDTKAINMAQSVEAAYSNLEFLETKVSSYLSTIDRLNAISGPLSIEQQTELSEAIGKVAKAIPSAITQVDLYGNALSVNTGFAREYINMQRKILAFDNKKAIKSLERDVARYEKHVKNIYRQLETPDYNPLSGGKLGQTDKITLDLMRSLGEYQEAIAVAQAKIKELQGMPIIEEESANKLNRLAKSIVTDLGNIKGAVDDLNEGGDDEDGTENGDPTGFDADELTKRSYDYFKALQSAYDEKYLIIQQNKLKENADLTALQEEELELQLAHLMAKNMVLAISGNEDIALMTQVAQKQFEIIQFKNKNISDSEEQRAKKSKEILEKELADLELLHNQKLFTLAENHIQEQLTEDQYKLALMEQEQLFLGQQYLLLDDAGKDTLSLAQKIAEGQIAINKWKNEQITEDELNAIQTRTESMEGQLDIAQNVTTMVRSLIDIAAEHDQKYAIFSQALALFEIGLEQGKAIAKAVGLAAAGSINPIELVANVTAAIATVMTGIASAYKAIKRAGDVPQFFEGGEYLVKGASDKRNYRAQFRPDIDGGDVNGPSLVLGGERGREYWVPSWMMNIPEIYNMTRWMENIRLTKQFAEGGFNNENNENNTEVLLSLKYSIDKLIVKLDEPMTSIIGDNQIRNLQSRIKLFDYVEKKAAV